MASTHTLVEGEKPNQAPTSSGFLDPKSDQSDFEQASTRAPSTAPDVDYEKKEGAGNVTDEETGNVGPAGPESTEASLAEYPTGARLLFIVVALVLSIFLVSLDMVRLVVTATENPTSPLHTRTWTDRIPLRQSLQQPYRRSRTNSMALTTSRGTAPPSS